MDIRESLDSIETMVKEMRREMNPDILEPEDLIHVGLQLERIARQMQNVHWHALGF